MREQPRRRNSLRYPGHDYAQPGMVFVTIDTAGNQRLFGTVVDAVMHHSPAGLAVSACWQGIPARFPGVSLDTFLVMPDHLHGILFMGTDPAVTALSTVGDIVRWFKSSLTREWHARVMAGEWPAYDRHLWHRDYYDRIVRNDTELTSIRAYIAANPARWWEKHGAEP